MVSYPGGLDSLTNPASTDLLTSPGHALQHSNLNDIAEALEKQAGTRGASFPVSPTSGDRHTYTTLNEDFEWNGTLWLSTKLRVMPIPYGAPSALPPFTATQASGHMVTHPFPGILDIWLEDFQLAFFVAGGGTALGASHKWVETLKHNPAGTTIGTISIDSGSSSVWRAATPVAVDALMDSTVFEFEMTSTKTGTPGALHAMPSLTYRLAFS